MGSGCTARGAKTLNGSLINIFHKAGLVSGQYRKPFIQQTRQGEWLQNQSNRRFKFNILGRKHDIGRKSQQLPWHQYQYEESNNQSQQEYYQQPYYEQNCQYQQQQMQQQIQLPLQNSFSLLLEN